MIPIYGFEVLEIKSRVKVIVSEYEAMAVNEKRYEAHKRYVDIQYLFKGTEKVCFLPIKLQETKPYQDESDATFYNAAIQPQEMVIGNGYFAFFILRLVIFQD